ncbi:sensor histidine kinase [Streptomyces sp. NRRL F-5123]|uniref:sensor histidine kinase n=1 Tax=Streptomyces sp. NRRL F-5123 TaxID=1463856 RepID=UPI000694801E|nr:sensor histidine kinase [Streptomyces sp. NRRL F-5123]
MTAPRTTGPGDAASPAFRHELYAYKGDSGFLQGAVSFVRDALAADETVLIAVGDDKRRMLRDALDGDSAGRQVSFVDTGALGRNPGRLIPAWHDWIAKSVGKGLPVRGISESPWDAATPAERGELRYHEWLLNLTFATSPAWWLLCPYDITTVETAVLDSARLCHPFQLSDGSHSRNPDFSDEPFRFDDLAPACGPGPSLAYGAGELAKVRAAVTECATRCGLAGARLQELLVAATEVAANTVRHGGGSGTLRMWADGSLLVCEFHDTGHIGDPLVGRSRPSPAQTGGRGLWLVHQLCDLVQIRSTPEHGTTVRLTTALY